MSQETVFDLIKDPTKENFLTCRELVITSPDYNPHSDDVDIMEKLYQTKE